MSGNLFIISAPSGAGKTSLVKALVDAEPDIRVSISHTTRPQRPGEENGVNYHFVSQASFQTLLAAGDFLEQAEVFGNFYGTSQAWVENALKSGTDVILEIDFQGAAQIRNKLDTITIFIVPPSLEALRERLQGRGQDDESVIKTRLDKAQAEISHYGEYDYLVVNDQFDVALEEIRSIIKSQRCKTTNQSDKQKNLLTDLLS